MSNELKNKIIVLTEKIINEDGLTSGQFVLVEIENPKEKQFGDWSLNIAMKLAKYYKKTPIDIARHLTSKLEIMLKEHGLDNKVEKIEIKNPGFINIFLSKNALYDVLDLIKKQKDDYGRSIIGKSQKILIEFVSANPTGPLSIAHARQAAVGDSLANILDFCGHEVSREYYINDEGNQINNLGLSLRARYNEKLGVNDIEFPEQGYRGEYLYGLAQALIDKEGEKYKSDKSPETLNILSAFAADSILNGIRDELETFGVRFDQWFSQKDHITQDKISEVLAILKKKGLIYESEGATWFKSTDFGDDKDRVVIKSDGLMTYLTPDIAYHKTKFDRGFDKLIDILGPDHHGYIHRIKSAACALGHNKDDLEVLIIQLATLSRNGHPVKMSTRAGEYITLEELLKEVGKDAARFFFLMRRCDSQLDFDLELAKKHSMDNPVYYVQYAHARIFSIFSSADNQKTDINNAEIDYNYIKEPECLALIGKLQQFPDTLQVCALNLDPQSLTTYLRELASDFHSFYNKYKVLDQDNWGITKARLILIDAIRQVIKTGLRLLGVSAPEKM